MESMPSFITLTAPVPILHVVQWGIVDPDIILTAQWFQKQKKYLGYFLPLFSILFSLLFFLFYMIILLHKNRYVYKRDNNLPYFRHKNNKQSPKAKDFFSETERT